MSAVSAGGALDASGLPVLRRLPVPVAEPRPALRVVRDPEPAVSDRQRVLRFDGYDDASPPSLRPAAPAPPPVERWAWQFVQAALEVSAGRRPLTQLLRWTSEEVFALLSRRAALAGRLDRERVERGRPTPVPATVRRLRTCEVRPGVVEVAAVVGDRTRARAVAARLEDAGGRWRVTALDFG